MHGFAALDIKIPFCYQCASYNKQHTERRKEMTKENREYISENLEKLKELKALYEKYYTPTTKSGRIYNAFMEMITKDIEYYERLKER